MAKVSGNSEQLRNRLAPEIDSDRGKSGNVTKTLLSGEKYTIIYEKPHSNAMSGKLTQFLNKLSATFKSLLSTSVTSQMSTPASQEKSFRNIKGETTSPFKPVSASDYSVTGKGGHSKYFDDFNFKSLPTTPLKSVSNSENTVTGMGGNGNIGDFKFKA